MKCPYCGFENPDRSSFCNSCGREISEVVAYAPPPSLRQCVSCGRSIPDYANVCPYCGHDYRYGAVPAPHEKIGTGIKILFYILSVLIPLAGFIIGAIYYSKDDRESKELGKWCLVLAVVAIVVSVGLSALLYSLIVGFGSGPDGMTPAVSLYKASVPYGVKFSIAAISRTTTWSDVEILLSDGVNFVDWSPSSARLSDSGSALTERFASVDLGDITVFLNVTDLVGNGNVNSGDYFTLTTGSLAMFSTSTTYTMTLIYEPSAGQMWSSAFTG